MAATAVIKMWTGCGQKRLGIGCRFARCRDRLL